MVRTGDSIELFIHSEGEREPRVVVVDDDRPLAQVLEDIGLVSDDEWHVFVGEPTDLIETSPGEEGESSHAAVDLAIPARDAGQGGFGHVHCHRCRRIRVTVQYRSKHHRWHASPATTIETLLEWAKRVFGLVGSDAEGLALRLCGEHANLSGLEHVGELTRPPECSLCFDLVPDPKMQG